MLASSNLDGQGPDSWAPQGMRFVNLGTAYLSPTQSIRLDLVVQSVGSYTPDDVTLNGLFGRVARINVAADSSVRLRLNLAPSCTPLEINCAACEHADMSASEQSACYAQGCSCYMQPCFSATCCDEAQQAELARAVHPDGVRSADARSAHAAGREHAGRDGV